MSKYLRYIFYTDTYIIFQAVYPKLITVMDLAVENYESIYLIWFISDRSEQGSSKSKKHLEDPIK